MIERLAAILWALFVCTWCAFAETLIINDPNDGWLNLRTGPGSSFSVLGRMDNGLRVEELERQGNWSFVRLPDGKTGWSFRKYMTSIDSSDTSRWSYANGEAEWVLYQNGEVAARVFLAKDEYLGGYYFGFLRPSNDPIVNFMGASVAHSNGRSQEIPISYCGGKDCLDQGQSSDGSWIDQVNIPIDEGNQAWILEEFQSGKDISFRFQTEQSAAQNSFKRLRMSLKGSRQAIDALVADERVFELDSGDDGGAETASSVSSSSSTTIAQTEPEIPTGGGQSNFVLDAADGANFCPAKEIPDYPPQSKDKAFESYWNDDAISRSIRDNAFPVETDFVGVGTTFWKQFPRNNSNTILYDNGTAVTMGDVIRDGRSVYGIRWKGNWKFEDGNGFSIYVKSVDKLSWGYEHFQCTKGWLTNVEHTIDHPGTGGRTCVIKMECSRWDDQYQEKRPLQEIGTLYEWSYDQIAPNELKFDPEKH